MNMTTAGSVPKLLLADDDGLVLATLGKGLRDAGYDVIECHDGDEALAACAESFPDLAMIDICMPKMSGFDLAQSLHAKRVPFVFLTARGDEEAINTAVEIGALGYVVKPTDVVRLLPTIKSALSRGADMRAMAEDSARMAASLESGRLVNVAVGIIMERFRLGRDEAFNLMRNKARSERRKIAVVAQEITASVDALNRLGSPDGTRQ